MRRLTTAWFLVATSSAAFGQAPAGAGTPLDEVIVAGKEYVGTYRFPSGLVAIVSRQGLGLSVQMPGEGVLDLTSLGHDEFATAQEPPARIRFVADEHGQIMGMDVHRDGVDTKATRVSGPEQNASLQAKVASQTPYPGSDVALRRFIDGVAKGSPDYHALAPVMAATVRRQLADFRASTALGLVVSLKFVGVDDQGNDLYDVTQEQGVARWSIRLGPTGLIGDAGPAPYGATATGQDQNRLAQGIPATSPNALEEVTVRARKEIDRRTLERAIIPKFIESHGQLNPRTDQIGRWRTRVCPFTAGLQPQFNEYVSRRVLAIAHTVGAPVQDIRFCTVNVEILFTATPQEQVDYLFKHRRVLLGYTRGSNDELATFRGPIQAWYVTGTRSTTVLGVFQGGAQIDNQFDIIFGEADHFHDVRSDILNVVIIADSTKVNAYSLKEVADYMAMLALTRASRVGCNELPSIMDILSPDCGARTLPTSITTADLAYLWGLYTALLQRQVHFERADMRSRMLKFLDTTDGANTNPKTH
jgi:hypothetical protein